MAEGPLKVLIVDDDEEACLLAEHVLRQAKAPSFAAARAHSLAEALDRLASGSYDVVLLDLTLPDSHGLETFQRLSEAAQDSAVILLSNLDDEKLALKAVQAGAQDYLLKGPEQQGLLVRAIRYAHERRRARVDAEKLKEEFLHHVSHELRSPLTAIYQAVQLLAAGIAGDARPDQKRLAEIAARNADHLKAMIDDLLETTRAETGKLVVEPRRMDAARLAAEVAAEKRLAADHRGVRLALDAAAVPLVFADPVRVRQVLMNLVDNALKFTPAGGSVTLACAPSPGEAGKVALSVADTGPGLPAEDARRVFERLYQARGVRPATGERKGLGLGLYISREIVLRSGGRLWVESEPGNGAAFRFTLPVFSFADVAAPAAAGGARRAAAVFAELYPPSHGMAEGSARTVRLECAALLRRQARDGESLLPEMSPSGAEGLLVYLAREPADDGAGVAARVRAVVAGSRVLQLHRLAPVVDTRLVEAGPAGLASALEASVEERLAARAARAREGGVIG